MLQVSGSSTLAVNRDATSTWEQFRGCEQRCYKYLGAVQGLRTEMLQVPGSSAGSVTEMLQVPGSSAGL